LTDSLPILHILLVEDDVENLKLLQESLPSELDGHQIKWEPCDDFEKAKELVTTRRYDVVVTDIYRDRTNHNKTGHPEDERAEDIVTALRASRFCPVVVFTDGSAPETFELGPFVRFADKSNPNNEILSELRELLSTGIPAIARRLHDDLDRSGGSYLWDFLESNWKQLGSTEASKPEVLERLVRRRAALQLGRLDPAGDVPKELESVHGLEYYIYPPISDELRLGEIIRNREDHTIRLILTPHCHLAVQHGDNSPRADYVLTVKTFPAEETMAKATAPKAPWSGTDDEKADKLRRRTKLVNAERLGKLSGRYCFLPAFLDIPDLCCDLLQIESLPLDTIENDFERLAALDTPFAEAVQSYFGRFYSAVGLPELDTAGIRHLME